MSEHIKFQIQYRRWINRQKLGQDQFQAAAVLALFEFENKELRAFLNDLQWKKSTIVMNLTFRSPPAQLWT